MPQTLFQMFLCFIYGITPKWVQNIIISISNPSDQHALFQFYFDTPKNAQIFRNDITKFFDDALRRQYAKEDDFRKMKNRLNPGKVFVRESKVTVHMDMYHPIYVESAHILDLLLKGVSIQFIMATSHVSGNVVVPPTNDTLCRATLDYKAQWKQYDDKIMRHWVSDTSKE